MTLLAPRFLALLLRPLTISSGPYRLDFVRTLWPGLYKQGHAVVFCVQKCELL